jgi:hypothetical protein
VFDYASSTTTSYPQLLSAGLSDGHSGVRSSTLRTLQQWVWTEPLLSGAAVGLATQALGLLRDDDEAFVRLAAIELITSWFSCEAAWRLGAPVCVGLKEAALDTLTDSDWEVKYELRTRTNSKMHTLQWLDALHA